MLNIVDEGRKTVNNIPLPVHSLYMHNTNSVWTPPHYHEYIEILYAVKGNFEVALNGEIMAMPEKSMFIINAGEPHVTKSNSEEDRWLLCIKFMPQVLFSSEQSATELEQVFQYIFEQFGKQRMFPKALLNGTSLPYAFNNVIEEMSEEPFGYELGIRAEVMRIFLWIIRYWNENEPEFSIDVAGNTEIISKIRGYVNEHYQDATLQSAAEHCGLSYSYISRVFKKYMNMGFSNYVNFVRLNKSVELFATDLSITEIAMAVGFSSTSYYIQAFKKAKNISPSKFRKMLKR